MKVAVIGAGRMGRRHIQVIKNVGLELCGVFDISRESLALAAQEHGLNQNKLFADVHRLFEETKPECVIVATTATTHCQYTCLAAEAGVKYILCEKPMAVSLEECDRMMESCSRYGTLLAINHQMRFMEQYSEPKRIIYSDDFGGLSSVTVIGGNFGMAMNGTHYFEMFRYLSDEKPKEVTAWFSNDIVPNPRGLQFQDRAGSVRVVTATGKRFYMEVGSDQGHGVMVVYSGPYGRLVVDELSGRMILSFREKQYRDLPTTRYGMPSVTELKDIAPADVISPTEAVMSALLNGKGYPTGDEGRMAVAVLVAAYVSNDHGHAPVAMGGDLPLQKTFPWA